MNYDSTDGIPAATDGTLFTAGPEVIELLLTLGFHDCHPSLSALRKFTWHHGGGLRIWVDQSYGFIEVLTLGGWHREYKKIPRAALEYLAANGLGTSTHKARFVMLAEAA